MNVERWILTAAWAGTMIAFAAGVPARRRREAVLILLFAQIITWPLSLLLVEVGMIRNPVREFVRAAGTNFTFNFVLYPAVAVFFCLYYPTGRSRKVQFLYQALFISGLVVFAEMVKRNSQLIETPHFNGMIGAIISLFFLNTTRIFADWYFGRLNRAEGVFERGASD